MVTFIGEYSGKMDDKGRIVFPASFKAVMPEGSTMEFVVKKNLFEDCLDIFTMEEWERQSQEVYERLDVKFNREHDKFWREYLRHRAVVIPDAKLGRISIPKQLLESIGITKEVVFSGCDYKIELWAKESYTSSGLSEDEFLAIADKLSSKR